MVTYKEVIASFNQPLAEYNQKLIEKRREDGSRDNERENIAQNPDAIRIDKLIYDILAQKEGEELIQSDNILAEVKGFIHFDSGRYYYVPVEELR